MNFVGYTYKADVEAEKSMLVNVLKELDSVSDQQFEPNEIQQHQTDDSLDGDMGNQNFNPDSQSYQNKVIAGGSRNSTNGTS